MSGLLVVLGIVVAAIAITSFILLIVEIADE